jgi:two-component system, cell cycle sensor histidine kinase and response regulator CckA
MSWILTMRLVLAAVAFIALPLSVTGQGLNFLTEQEQAGLAAHPSITLAPNPDFPPVEYFMAGASGYFPHLSFAVRSDWPELLSTQPHNRVPKKPQVIPAKGGIQKKAWMPAFAGMTLWISDTYLRGPVLSILEKALAQISPSERQAIQGKWVHLDSERVLTRRELWIGGLVGLGLVLLTLYGILAWNASLRKMVQERTRDLRKELSERHQAEESLQRSEEKYRALVQNANSIILRMDPNGCITFFNEYAQSFLGFQEVEIIGKNVVGTIVPEMDRTGFDLAAKIKDLAAHPERYPINDNENMRKNGERVWISWTNRAILDDSGNLLEILCVGNDITQRRLVEERLRKSETTLKTILQAAPVGIGLVNHRVVSWVSGQISQMIGYTEDELIGQSSRMVYENDAEYERVGMEKYAQIRHAGAAEVDTRWKHKDGRVIDVYLRSKAIDPQDLSAGVIFTALDITERKRIARELQENEEKYRHLFEMESDAILLVATDTGEIFEANAAASSLYGYRREDLLRMRNVDLSAEPEAMWKAMREQHRRVPLGLHRKKDGTDFSVEISLSHFAWNDRSVHVAAIRDITERQKAYEEIEKQRAFLRSVIDTSPSFIYVKDNDARVVLCNRAFAENLGLSVEEIMGKTAFDLVPDPERAEAIHRDDLAILRHQTERIEREERYFDGFGNECWTYTVKVPLKDTSGKVRRLIGISTDITERKRAEEERRKLEARVLHVQKLESLGIMAGGIAHDFNNILMAILGNADLALLGLSPVSPARDNLIAITKASQRAAELCKQMLAYSGRGRFVIEPLDITEVVQEMTHMLEVSTCKKAVLKYNFADNLPAIEADATQVRQVIMNLITNASEAIGDRSGIISVSTGAMECDRAYLSESHLDEQLPEGIYTYIEVSDTGSGMDSETCSRIFDPFFTTKFTGRGLGLAAVLGIVRGHKGAIKVYSEPGRGTTFKALFPASKQPMRVSHQEPVGGEDWRFKGTVLIVDDEESVRAVGKQMLEHMGLAVLTAEDGREALKVFGQHPDEIACVILDLTMPHMDGEETFRELRRIRRGLCVLMSSGYNEQEVTQRFAGQGLAGFIQKPYKYEDLAAKLRELLDRV